MCTVGRICNRCTGCVAIATQREREMLASTCLYSLYAPSVYFMTMSVVVFYHFVDKTELNVILRRFWCVLFDGSARAPASGRGLVQVCEERTVVTCTSESLSRSADD